MKTSPAYTRPGELRGEEPSLVADAIELDVDARAGDQYRDLDREALLTDAAGRLREGLQLLDEQIAPVADLIELNLEERRRDIGRHRDVERSLTRALLALRG